MIPIAQILQKKGSNVWIVGPDAPVLDALKYMAQRNVGALLVMKDDRVVGIFSERDYARKVILMGRTSSETPVKDVMTTRVLYVEPKTTIEEAMALMTDKRIRHLPVLDEGVLMGMVSIGDLVKAIIEDQQFTIEQLENYIHVRW